MVWIFGDIICLFEAVPLVDSFSGGEACGGLCDANHFLKPSSILSFHITEEGCDAGSQCPPSLVYIYRCLVEYLLNLTNMKVIMS